MIEDEIKKLLLNKKSISEIKNKLGVTEWKIRTVKKNLAQLELPQTSTTDVDQNHKIIEVTSEQIKTLDELLLVCKIDLDEWEIERHTINKWDIGAKDKNGIVSATPMFQIKASLVKKIFLNTPLTIQPIHVEVNDLVLPKKTTSKAGIKKAVVIPDIQVGFRKHPDTGELSPFHDRRAINLAMQLVKHIQPDRVVYLGDNLDLADFSDKFVVSPSFLATTQPSIVELAWIYGQTRKLAPIAKIDAIEGNHECFDDKTEVLTNNGWKWFEDLTDQDKVAGFDIDDRSIKFDYPIDVHKYPFNGQLGTIKNTIVDLAVTPNHRILYRTTDSEDNYELAYKLNEFNEFKDEYTAKLPIAGNNNNPDLPMSDDEIKLGAWLVKFNWEGKQKLVMRPSFTVSEDLRNILLALNVNFRSVSSFNKPAVSVDILRNYKVTERTFYIRVAPDSLAYCQKFLDSQGRLPNWVKNLSERQFELFINTFMDTAFKSTFNDGRRLIKVSKEFGEDLQIACVQNGYRAILRPSTKGLYGITLSKIQEAPLRMKSVLGVMDYSGYVYCVTTKQDTVVVRRNGKVCITGNSRMERAVMKNLKQVHSLRPANKLHEEPVLSIPKLLGLDELQITYHGPYPEGEVWINDNFVIHHGSVVRSGSGKTVSKVVEDARSNEAFGHIHRLEMASKTVWSYDGPKTYQAWSFGTLASIKPGVVPAFKAKNNWQQGIGVVEYEEGNGFINITPIFFYNGVAIYNQTKFIAANEDDIKKALIKDTGYKF